MNKKILYKTSTPWTAKDGTSGTHEALVVGVARSVQPNASFTEYRTERVLSEIGVPPQEIRRTPPTSFAVTTNPVVLRKLIDCGIVKILTVKI